jgi:hypothetical protein
MFKTLYLETDFLQFDIEGVSYEIDYIYPEDIEENEKDKTDILKYGFDTYVDYKIKNLKIQKGSIFIDFYELENFLEKYFGDEYDISLFWKFWNWQNEYNEEDQIEIYKGKLQYPDLKFDNYIIKNFMKYIYDDAEICNDEYNIYAIIGIYEIIDDILIEIVFNSVEIIEKKIIEEEIIWYIIEPESNRTNWFDRYKIKITPEELGIAGLLEKCLNYRKTTNKILKTIKANLDNFLKSEEFSELIQNYLLEEEISVRKFVEEIKLQLDFWDSFYIKFFKNCSKICPELSENKDIDKFIIPRIHDIAVEKVKSKLKPFLI